MPMSALIALPKKRTLPIPQTLNCTKRSLINVPNKLKNQASNCAGATSEQASNWSGTPITATTHPKRRRQANAAKRKLKTIAGRLVREPERKLPEGFYSTELELYKKVLAQEKNSKNKIYSLHEPEVYCMSKGKAHKKHEYGCKASVVLTQKTGIIVGAMTFGANVYDGHTLEDVLEQTKNLTGKTPKTATVDRGYKGKQMVANTQINIPKPPLKKDSEYQKRKKRKHFRRRAAIEPIIGHLKSDHRVARNFLKGQTGDAINFIMAAAGFNFRKLMKKLKENKLWLYAQITIKRNFTNQKPQCCVINY